MWITLLLCDSNNLKHLWKFWGGGNIQKLIFISPMIFFGLYYAIPILPPTKPRLINKMIKNVVCYDIAQKRLVNLYK